MTSKSRVTTTIVSDSHARVKVEGVPTPLTLDYEEQEGTTITTADMTQVTQITKAGIQANTFESVTDEIAQSIGTNTNQLQFMTGHQMKGRSERILDKAY